MPYSMSERLVRQRLRDNKDLGRNPAELKPAMEALALRERFKAAACACGANGLIYRW